MFSGILILRIGTWLGTICPTNGPKYDIIMKNLLFASLLLLCPPSVSAAGTKARTLVSPDGRVAVTLYSGDELAYGVSVDGTEIIARTPIALTLDDGRVWGGSASPVRIRRGNVAASFATPFYIKSQVDDRYAWLRAEFRQGFALELRAYDDGAAYRFVSTLDRPVKIASETAGARFTDDWLCRVPYVRDCDGEEIVPFGKQFKTSFENLYTTGRLSELDPARLAFLPVTVETDRGVTLCFAESDLQAYPGMYLNNPDGSTALRGVFAPYPARTHDGGHDGLQNIVDEYSGFIAQAAPRASFPWRAVIVARHDRELLNSDMVMRLAEPSRIADPSWIRPGKAAWEWWNDWGLYDVGFEAGIDTPTYKHYIDFAARNGLEYMVIDDGWSKDKTDLLQGACDALDLPEIVRYGAERGVGILLWAGYRAFDRDMEEVCRRYSDMGVKGFKVDFMDRDDQLIAEFLYRGAATAARYGLLLDYHGVNKPAGLQRTWPNVLNFEGVHGLEQMKWSPEEVDQITYDVTMPFIRMAAGPVDYTQGAMANAAAGHFAPRRAEPMSQGTRCRQIAEYVVFHAPLAMLCDSPSNYDREQECTSFIAGIPTVWDDTRPLDGRIGEYVVVARRCGEVWYVGGLTGREGRRVGVDLGFLGDGAFRAELFRDGANAAKYGRDYRRESLLLGESRTLEIEMAPGGGFVLKIEKVQNN